LWTSFDEISFFDQFSEWQAEILGVSWMCGIVAMFSRASPIPPGTIEKATQSLKHRGPDGQRYWRSPDQQVALGHARLSIIDLTTGDQPIANEDESLRIVVNGELYGYEAIQKELEERGHRLRTRSDSEIVLHLYEELGAQCLHRLRGEFAIVLWDSSNRTLFAARDRFGIKPLFYAFHEETLYLASEVKALFAAGVPARWDCEAIYDSGAFGGPQMRTLYDGIFQVPPGHYLLATERHILVDKYWDFDYPAAKNCAPEKSDAEYAEQFRQALEDAVRVRLRADVPVGCYLSGGIDSCAVLGLAAKHHQGPLRAYTLTFDRPEYNEGDVAQEMAKKAGADFCPIPICQDDLAENFADAIHQSELLCVNSHGVAKFLLSRAVRESGYKVVLTGEGSDEILGGYMHFRRDLSARNGKGALPIGGENSGAGPALEGIRRLLGFVPGWMESSTALSTKMRGLMSDEFLEAHKGREGFRSFFNDIDVRGQLTGREPLHQSLYLWSKTRLSNYLLTILGDRMEMAHSIEGRLPFLDHQLVELVRTQPVTQKIRGGSHKFVLRESMREVITEEVYRRPKQPFLSPPAMLNQQGKFSILMQDVLRGSALAAIPFFNQKRVISLLESLHTSDEATRIINDQVLMMALSACVLHERFRLTA
jgi:asparagine synthase (glutamine-hydrolysing)